MSSNLSLLAAFVAGVLSITSPCVLPLLPLYVAHLAGLSSGPDGDVPNRGVVLSNAFAYVLGFSTVFVALGVALGAAGALVDAASVVSTHRYWFVRFGGIFLALLGLQQIGLIHLPFLDRDHRVHANGKAGGQITSSFLVGVTFGAGWSPCVGPVLGAILTLAASQGDIRQAAILLVFYSAGLAIPFMIVAAFGARSGMLSAVSQRLRRLTGLSGAVMLAVGVTMILGLYQQFFARLVALAPWTPWEPKL